VERDTQLPASPTDPEPDPGQAPATPTLLSPLSILGIIALVACAVCTITLLVRGDEQPSLLLGLGAAASGLLGAWLLAWGRSWKISIPVALLFLGLGALAFSLRAVSLGWPCLGLGLGALGAWSYARRHRAVIATHTLLAAGYAVAAVAFLLMATRGQGHWWIAGQGLGSLILGGLLLRLGSPDASSAPEASSTPDAPGPPEGAEQPSTRHARLRIAGRLLIVCGILLPYAALVLLAVGRALAG
jgi:hypothetical protein